jgi:chaperonin GroEL (HSP60 family)
VIAHRFLVIFCGELLHESRVLIGKGMKPQILSETLKKVKEDIKSICEEKKVCLRVSNNDNEGRAEVSIDNSSENKLNEEIGKDVNNSSKNDLDLSFRNPTSYNMNNLKKVLQGVIKKTKYWKIFWWIQS